MKDITAIGVKLGKPSLAAIQALKLKKEDIEVFSVDLDKELAGNQALLTIGAHHDGHDDC
jgi:hypothetical protein